MRRTVELKKKKQETFNLILNYTIVSNPAQLVLFDIPVYNKTHLEGIQ